MSTISQTESDKSIWVIVALLYKVATLPYYASLVYLSYSLYTGFETLKSSSFFTFILLGYFLCIILFSVVNVIEAYPGTITQLISLRYIKDPTQFMNHHRLLITFLKWVYIIITIFVLFFQTCILNHMDYSLYELFTHCFILYIPIVFILLACVVYYLTFNIISKEE
ncbi:hypothetical protein WA158_005698, partial [Blastocystis sp. Blastoise]